MGMFASINPAEDLYLHMRTGFQIDEYTTRRKPTAYRADLADAVAKSATVSQLIITLITKLAVQQHAASDEERDPSRRGDELSRFLRLRVNHLDHESGYDVPHPPAGMLNKTHCMADQPIDLRLHGSAHAGVGTGRVTDESDDEGSPRESGSEYQRLL